MAPRRNAHSTSAEISLAHLKNCFVNLPASLVSLLENVNTLAQNVIVELSYRPAPNSAGTTVGSGAGASRSIYLGWTGMKSKRRIAPLVGRDGINGSRGSGSRDQEVPLVEIDPSLARTLGLHDGQKVTVSIHVDPPVAHTINIEPLTPEDWEIIELHANFLELHLVSQIRALPNPVFAPSGGGGSAPHPLTLHVSPTSTANIKILSFEPALPADAPFAKIAPDAEVIVAPKTRAKPSRSSRENRSVASTSKKSGRSTTSTVKKRTGREESKPSLFLRAIDRKLLDGGPDDAKIEEQLTVWVDPDLLLPKEFRGAEWATVSYARAHAASATPDPQTKAAAEAGGIEPARKIVARLRAWDSTPNGQLAALSSPLCAALGCQGVVGGAVKIEPAPTPLQDYPQKFKVYPFSNDTSDQTKGLKFGGESQAEREEAAKRIKQIYNNKSPSSLLRGPLTDGLVLTPHGHGAGPVSGWLGGILKFDSAKGQAVKDGTNWVLGPSKDIILEVQPAIPRPVTVSDPESEDAAAIEQLVGIDTLLHKVQSHLASMSSVLLTGALGSGKTSIAHALARRLKEDELFHTSYFPCRKLVTDETRVATIKQTLTRLFMAASWGARRGGKAVVILDDLDRLCPVETELQVGNDNNRSLQISQTICNIVRQYVGHSSGVVVLATAQGKDELHKVLVGGHVFRESIGLEAPDKETRRKVMESITKQNVAVPQEPRRLPSSMGSRPTTADGSAVSEDGAWMDGASQQERRDSFSPVDGGFVLQDDLDFLDLAGEIDGYMPGDITMLVARARHEALMRAASEVTLRSGDSSVVELARIDFTNALKGFTPASLRNVTLQHSTTTFASIGGLKETRRILQETLEYPTKYAPIFDQVPLRLRSGLLLYGYPGCGKTLLASAVAGECGLNFISVKGPEILNKYIGASEKSVRDLFERAQAAKPCVLFFDEFDSVAPKRGHDSTGVTDRVVNQLLTQMDGAEGLSGVYVLAATSRPDLIDPALLRPGRLDKSLLCDFPDGDDRIDIFQALVKKAKLEDDVLSDQDSLQELASRTEGFSGADLQALVSNAQLEAIHDVLNEASAPTARGSSVAKRANGASSAPTSARTNFVKFTYGAEEAAKQSQQEVKSRSAQLVEQAAITAKLQAIKLAQKRMKALKPPGVPGRPGADEAEKANKDVVIGWRHIIRALDATRPSVSSAERLRLQRIYHEFVVGRSGDMKDGQGSMEVGGRSSLM